MIVIFSFGTARAQNLVPNYSFEEGEDECDFTLKASFFGTYAYGWSCPTNGTSDTFSTRIQNPGCFAYMPDVGIDRVPYFPHIGSIMPRTGKRFAGIFVYGPRTWLYNYREYLRVSLNEPMIPGKNYCVEYYTAVAGKPRYAANNLGVHFMDEFIRHTPHDTVLRYQPQVLNKEIITSTSWVRVRAVYKATSAHTVMIIGNFFNDAETQFIDRGDYNVNFSWNPYAYYFIDDVSVSPIEDVPLYQPGPTTICQGELALIEANPLLEEVKWTLLSDTLSVVSHGNLRVSPGVTTTYRVTGKNCSLFVADTLTIQVNPVPEVDLGEDVVACVGETVLLDAGPGHAQYQWLTGVHHEQTLSVALAGTYGVIVSNEHNCTAADQISVAFREAPQVTLGSDQVVCREYYPLSTGSLEASLVWSDGSREETWLPEGPGTFWVKAVNECGEDTDTVSVYSYRHVFLPNVVTPNSDGKNDFFAMHFQSKEGVLMDGVQPHGQVSVFDRWGKEIFQSNDYANNWPRPAEDVLPGVYYYTVTFPSCNTYKGWLHVMR